jgi:hypothetical protein
MRGRMDGARSCSSVVAWSLAIVEDALRHCDANWLVLLYEASWLGYWMLLCRVDKAVEYVQRATQSSQVIYRGTLLINKLRETGSIFGISNPR